MDARVSSHAAVGTPPPPGTPPDEVTSEGFRAIDRLSKALVAHATGGLSPAAVSLAFFDWGLHLATSPGKQAELTFKAFEKGLRLFSHAAAVALDKDTKPCIEPLPGDTRFQAPEWKKQPFSLLYQAFLLNQQWWHNVTHEVPGVAPHHEDVVSFLLRQWLDMASPSNHLLTNPEVMHETISAGGFNLVQGVRNLAEDWSRLADGGRSGEADFVPGANVAVTPGKVVFRNHLIELIQYAPTTDTVHAEPILIVPAWIMKYYILDLSPQNSLIRYLVAKGHTVFCISWRNPSAADRDLTLDDYRRLGPMAALEAIGTIVPDRRIHAAGYCLGGTLLAITAAAMARAGDDRLASVTLLAAQTDFSEPGELALFIDHSQVHFLESAMWNRGYLSADQMAAAFQLLRSNDLVWSRMVHDYLMGERARPNDLMAWNADSTHMPYRMHAEYLERLYLDNEFAAGRFLVDERAAAPQNIRVPLFVVGTEKDHVAPWRSVYKIHLLADVEVTFVLTSGGHNAGIVSEPGHPGRHYRISTDSPEIHYVGPDEWATGIEEKQGSWWPEWTSWLAARSTGRTRPPPLGLRKVSASLPDAPGTYVFQR